MASINDLLAGSDMQKRVSTLLQKDGVDTQLKYTVTAAQQETQTGTGNAASQAFVDWNQQLQVVQIERAIPALEKQLLRYQTAASKLSTDYVLLKQRLADLQILQATVNGNYRILSPASAPIEPYAPKPLRSAILGFGVGLFAGIGLAFLLEQFDTRVRRPDEVAAALRQPILGRIPRISSKLLGDSALVTMRHPEGHIAEAFRMVRTNLEFMAVDGDMRRPRQHKLFGLENERGLSTVATGRSNLMESMVRVEQATSASGPWTLLYIVTTSSGDYSTGTYSGPVMPVQNTWYRFVFEGTADFAASTSNVLAIQVKPVLGKPSCPAKVKHGKKFTVKGTLKPHFMAGAKTVKIRVFKLNSHKRWVVYKNYTATNRDYKSFTKYVLRLKIAKKGQYRFKARTMATASFAAAVSGYSRTLRVK